MMDLIGMLSTCWSLIAGFFSLPDTTNLTFHLPNAQFNLVKGNAKFQLNGKVQILIIYTLFFMIKY